MNDLNATRMFAISADTALAIADGIEPGDLREAARVLASNARWYKDEYERLRKAYAHDVRPNAEAHGRAVARTVQPLVGNSEMEVAHGKG
jgi:hypothetical protein